MAAKHIEERIIIAGNAIDLAATVDEYAGITSVLDAYRLQYPIQARLAREAHEPILRRLQVTGQPVRVKGAIRDTLYEILSPGGRCQIRYA